jgi:hypothetical protein
MVMLLERSSSESLPEENRNGSWVETLRREVMK